jgi:hypothetical protein
VTSIASVSVRVRKLLPLPPNLSAKLPRVKMFWTIGCIYGASSVMLGAFGAHGLKKHIADPARLANWSTAAQYQVNVSKS